MREKKDMKKAMEVGMGECIQYLNKLGYKIRFKDFDSYCNARSGFGWSKYITVARSWFDEFQRNKEEAKLKFYYTLGHELAHKFTRNWIFSVDFPIYLWKLLKGKITGKKQKGISFRGWCEECFCDYNSIRFVTKEYQNRGAHIKAMGLKKETWESQSSHYTDLIHPSWNYRCEVIKKGLDLEALIDSIAIYTECQSYNQIERVKKYYIKREEIIHKRKVIH